MQPHWFGCHIIYLGCGVTRFAADLTVVLRNLLPRLLSAKGLKNVRMWFFLNKDILPLPLPQPPLSYLWFPIASFCPARIDELAAYAIRGEALIIKLGHEESYVMKWQGSLRNV